MQESRTQLNPGDPVSPDGDTGAVLARVFIATAGQVFKIAHGLNRVPIKAYVVESTGQPFACYTIFKDADQIHIGFFVSDLTFTLTGGTALVRIG